MTTHTTTARRLAVALTLPVLLLTAACGSEDAGDGKAAEQVSIEVTGAFGEQPKISTSKEGEPPAEPVVQTLVEGDGEKVAKGDFVRLDFTGQTMKESRSLGGTWQTAKRSEGDGPRRQLVARLGQPNTQLPKKVLNTLVGSSAGSRVQVSGTAEGLIGDQLNPESGLQAEDGLVFVLDVVAAAAVDATTSVEGEQAAPAEGLPEVKAAKGKAADIAVPKGQQPPEELKEQVLIEGDGPEVEAGEGLIAQYTGVKWEDGEKFDSSWDHGGATGFQIGTGSVVEGWDAGLTGKRIGDRVALVIPPELAYGGSPQSELAENTLVFVVDIVGKV